MTDQPRDDAKTNEVQDRLFEMFADDEEFVGTALGQDTGAPVVLAIVTDNFDVTRLPESLEGMPVRPLVTGMFEPDATDPP
jgi:hypothetical protein